MKTAKRQHTLSVQQISKAYNGRTVVNNISIKLHGGEIVGLLGPNGAGKTSCFYMMLGLIHPDSGSITLNEKDITALPIHMRARLGIGYLPQEPSVFRKLTVAQNIMAILQTRSDLIDGDRDSLLENLLYEFRISHIRDTVGFSLSGGERRRVEIARALASNPHFMLLDEPFAGVDPISIIDIKQVATHLSNKGIGVLITDHNVRDTLDICHRVYIVNQGQVIAEGTPEHILNHSEVRKVYLGAEF
jgi:lipopolysaccharide export system ATP-binding protein